MGPAASFQDEHRCAEAPWPSDPPKPTFGDPKAMWKSKHLGPFLEAKKVTPGCPGFWRVLFGSPWGCLKPGEPGTLSSASLPFRVSMRYEVRSGEGGQSYRLSLRTSENGKNEDSDTAGCAFRGCPAWISGFLRCSPYSERRVAK